MGVVGAPLTRRVRDNRCPFCYDPIVEFVALSSSRGTTFRAVIEAMKKGTLSARCHGLVTDRADRECTNVARAAGLPVRIVERRRGETRDAYDDRLHAAIIDLMPKSAGLQCIAALGWMYILSPAFIRRWHRRIINVHPALLPKYPGAHAIVETLAAKDRCSGMTIHLIDEGVDTGPILLQASCPVLEDDSETTLKDRIQSLEKLWYPRLLHMLSSGALSLDTLHQVHSGEPLGEKD